uniref:Myosin tail domain-containing protein n=1 Tax=Parascaris equorum TaxID=6256 RepID=A0A914RSP2_PAREQ
MLAKCRFSYICGLPFDSCVIVSFAGVTIIQRNVRSWCTLRNWSWFKLYGRVKPLIQGSKKDEEFEALEQKCKELEEKFSREEKLRKDTETELAKLRAEKQEVFLQLEQERDNNAESEERAAKLLAQKSDFEKQLVGLAEQLNEQEDRYDTLLKAKRKAESDNDVLKKNIGELENMIRKQESEKQAKDHQIRSLQVGFV